MKIITTAEGGMATTNSDQLAEALKNYEHMGLLKTQKKWKMNHMVAGTMSNNYLDITID